MQVAVRSYLTAGVALIGAGAIVAAPITPTPPDIQVPAIYSANVELAALVNPIVLWGEVITTSLDNVGALAQTVIAAPAPILGSVVGNQLITAQVLASFATTFGEGFVGALGDVPPALQAAFGEILAGNISVGVQAVAGALLAPVLAGAFGALGQLPNVAAVLQNPFLNMANVIGTVVSINTLISLGLPLITEALAPVFQLAATTQAIFDGVRTGNLEAVANALISFPSDMVGTILNGSAAGGNAGILSSPFGLFAGLLTLRQAIADALTPPVLAPAPIIMARTMAATSADIAAIPEATAAIVSLDAPATQAVEAEPAGEPATEAATTTDAEEETDASNEPEETVKDDPRTDTKDGNKAVPGEVNTGVTGTGTPTTPTTEPTTVAVDPEPAEPAAEADDTPDGGAGAAEAGSGAGDDGGDS